MYTITISGDGKSLMENTENDCLIDILEMLKVIPIVYYHITR